MVQLKPAYISDNIHVDGNIEFTTVGGRQYKLTQDDNIIKSDNTVTNSTSLLNSTDKSELDDDDITTSIIKEYGIGYLYFLEWL